jgi:hypothetical protein
MRKTTIRAALAAALVLTLTPAVATAPVASAQSGGTQTQAVDGEQARAHVHDESPRVAPGQERADFHAWLARAPENRSSVQSFRNHLKANGVDDVMPIWQLVRTSSSWRECAAGRFEVAPRDKWDNIVTTLKFIERDVEPAVGDVQAVSGYRNASLNSCSNGAPASAHRMFFALDLMPVDEDVSRGELVSKVCAAHARDGRAFKTGLGFYNGVRFHVDSNGFRKWGPNGSGATSPCVSGA